MSDPVYTDGSEIVTDASVITPSNAEVMDVVRSAVARGALLKLGQVALPDMGEEVQNFHRASVRLDRTGSPDDSDAWADLEQDPDSSSHAIANQYRSNWGWVHVEFFRAGAIDRANRLRLWLRSEFGFGATYGDSQGYRIGQINAITNLTGLEEKLGLVRGRPEERVKTEFRLNWDERIVSRVELIEGFTVESNGGVLSDGHNRIPLTLNVDKPTP